MAYRAPTQSSWEPLRTVDARCSWESADPSRSLTSLFTLSRHFCEPAVSHRDVLWHRPLGCLSLRVLEVVLGALEGQRRLGSGWRPPAQRSSPWGWAGRPGRRWWAPPGSRPWRPPPSGRPTPSCTHSPPSALCRVAGTRWPWGCRASRTFLSGHGLISRGCCGLCCGRWG